MGLFGKSDQDKMEALVGKMLPKEREAIRPLVTKLTNELMEKTQQCRMLERELKGAVKRKKAEKDSRLGNVCCVMFSKPKADNAPIRCHVVETHGAAAIAAVQKLLRDRENYFIGAYFLLPMQGREDGIRNLESNVQATWELYQNLDRDLDKHLDADKNKKEADNAETADA